MKRIYTILVIGCLLLALCACANQAAANDTTDTPTPNGALVGIKSDIDLYEAIGEIIKFEELKVHILSGDIVEVFEATKAAITKLYIGQTVGVKKENMAIEPYLIENPSKRFTTMGQQIHSVSGEVKGFNDNYLTILKDNKDIVFKLYTKTDFEIGSTITVDYTEGSIYGDTTKEKDRRALINFYKEAHSYELNIKAINRLESGTMMLETEDNQGLKYHVFLVEGCVTDFNYSELKVDDRILVYPEIIREIYPNEVDAKKVSLIVE